MWNRTKYFFIKLVYIAIDFVCIYFVIFTSCLLRKKLVGFPVDFPQFFLAPESPFRFIFLFWAITTIFFMYANNLYQTRREIIEGLEIWHVIKSVIFSSLVMVLAIYGLKIEGFSRTVFMNAAMGMMIVLSFWRVIKRWFVEYLVAHGYNNFNVLIIGAGKVGTALAAEIKKRPALGIKVIGFLDDFKKSNGEEFKIIGTISDFTDIARREFVNKVFITVHHDSNVFLELLAQARAMGIAVRVVPQGFDLTTGDFVKYNIGFIPILEYADMVNFKRQAGKRLFDFIASLISIVISLPAIFIIGILIKLDNPGPVFYISKRYGRGGRMFNMYKFRSMVTNADRTLNELRHQNEADGPIFKIKNDPRITKFGRRLRKYSLDELPQIFNVLKGEMSLVGPRPLPIDQVEKEDFRQLQRLEVRPGITGLWQVRGRSDISFGRLVKWDIWYINNWSFWLDLAILFQTIPVVFRGKGAY